MNVVNFRSGALVSDFSEAQALLDQKGIVSFKEIDYRHFGIVGRKSAELGTQSAKGQTTDGFASTEAFFRWFEEESSIDGKSFKQHRQELFAEFRQYFGHDEDGSWVGKDLAQIHELERRIKALIARIVEERAYSARLAEKIEKQHILFRATYGDGVSFFVRSSGKFEDMDVADGSGAKKKIASAAGQNTTVPNVIGSDNVIKAWFECAASLYNSRSMSDRFESGFNEDEAAMMVTFHRTLNSAVAGIAFTIESFSGNPGIMKITIGRGQGEPLVSGDYGTCTYYLSKDLVAARLSGANVNPILKKLFVEQEEMTIADAAGGLREVPVSRAIVHQFPVSDDTIAKFGDDMLREELAKIAVGAVTSPYQAGRDLEFGAETTDHRPLEAGNTPEHILFLQSRAETTFSGQFGDGFYTARYKMGPEAATAERVAETGTKTSKGVAQGRIKIVRPDGHMKADMVKLVALANELKARNEKVIYLGLEANPDVNDALTLADGMMIGHASTDCHGSILARAKRKPAAVQMFRSMRFEENEGVLKAICVDQSGREVEFTDGQYITFAVTDDYPKPVVFKGKIPFVEERIYNNDLPNTHRKVSSIVADAGTSTSTSQVADRLSYGLWRSAYHVWALALADKLPRDPSERVRLLEGVLGEYASEIEDLPIERVSYGPPMADIAFPDSLRKILGELKASLGASVVTADMLSPLVSRARRVGQLGVVLFRTELIYAQQLEAHPLIFFEYEEHRQFVHHCETTHSSDLSYWVEKAGKGDDLAKQYLYERDLVEFVRRKSDGYASPVEFAKETIKQELLMMYEMYGRVEVRLYDNKPAEIKEYKGADTKIGNMPKINQVAKNEEFDPVRGSGLFLTPGFQDAWRAIELAAIREVQQEVSARYGHDAGHEIKPFIVFSRTQSEYLAVKRMVEAAGITGVGVMIETPENYLNAEGYMVDPPAFVSIGGNDSEATIYAVARADRVLRNIPGLVNKVGLGLIGAIIEIVSFYNVLGIPVYTCGQNNSDNLLIAQLSALLPFSAVGVTEDVTPEVIMAISAIEKRLRNEFGGNVDVALRSHLAVLFEPIVEQDLPNLPQGWTKVGLTDYYVMTAINRIDQGKQRAVAVREFRTRLTTTPS